MKEEKVQQEEIFSDSSEDGVPVRPCVRRKSRGRGEASDFVRFMAGRCGLKVIMHVKIRQG